MRERCWGGVDWRVGGGVDGWMGGCGRLERGGEWIWSRGSRRRARWGSAARRRRFGGWSSAPLLAKKCPTCQKAHARETHGCGSGAANSGKGVGIATRDIGRWACRGKCLGGRRG